MMSIITMDAEGSKFQQFHFVTYYSTITWDLSTNPKSYKSKLELFLDNYHKTLTIFFSPNPFFLYNHNIKVELQHLCCIMKW